jgi:D-arabinose 1-dehydrogenase-like Zn-dependent alcohol dehydrogenase
MTRKTHRARLVETGWDKSLVCEDATLPEPTGTQVVVEIEACGVCYRDLIDREGRFAFIRLPITPGHEAVGRVIATGPAVTRWSVGDRVATLHRDSCGQCPMCLSGETSLCERAAWVLGILADGGYAQHLLVPESGLYPMPVEIPAPEAAVYQCTFGTAYRSMCTLSGLKAGERVLVTGANGGVGTAAVQIASRLGAEVVAVVRDPRHKEYLSSLGAHHVVVDPGTGFHKTVGKVNVALDCVGQPTFNSALRSLKQGGRLAVVGNVVPEQVGLNLGYVITQGLRIVGSSGATERDMAQVLDLGRIQPLHMPIDRTYGLAGADEAQRRVKAGNLEGRVVLLPHLDS